MDVWGNENGNDEIGFGKLKMQMDLNDWGNENGKDGFEFGKLKMGKMI